MSRDGFTMKTPAELAEARENARIYAEDRKRDREWDRLVAKNARLGLYLHPLEDPTVNPWSESRFSPCPPWCTKHRGTA